MRYWGVFGDEGTDLVGKYTPGSELIIGLGSTENSNNSPFTNALSNHERNSALFNSRSLWKYPRPIAVLGDEMFTFPTT